MMRMTHRLLGAAAGLLAFAGVAHAAETVSIGCSRAVLVRPAAPVGSVILMPGGDGRIEVGSDGHS